MCRVPAERKAAKFAILLILLVFEKGGGGRSEVSFQFEDKLLCRHSLFALGSALLELPPYKAISFVV